MILEKVKKLISEQLGVEESEIELESSFQDDLEADSLDVVELVMAIEDEFDIEIPDAQSFYITDDGIVIYFGLDEIAPSQFGIPKFKMSFSKFAPYINSRFYCTPSTYSPEPRNFYIHSRYR